jgi:uncharacterized membrane protein
MWFFIATIGYILLGIVFVLDKFILEKSVSTPVVYTFYSTIFMFAALLAYPFGAGVLFGIDWMWAVVAGLGFGFGLWTLFQAIRLGETSHISPFVGAFIVVFTYICSSIFLGETLTIVQMSGISILLVASFLLSFEKSEKYNGFHFGFVWAILSAFLFAVSHVATKYIYEQYDFLTGFVWTRAFVGIVGLITLFFPSVWCIFKKKKKEKKRKIQDKTFVEKHAFGIVVSNKILAVFGVVAIQYAIAIGSVTLVNALAGMQYIFMFIIIIGLTTFAPKVFKEDFTRRELITESVAILFVIIGSALLII